MKEIGGYFGLEQFSGKEYYPELIPVANGRSALGYLLKARTIQKLYVPYFLCGSVSDFCQREGCAVEFYHIDRDFLPRFEKMLSEGEYLYIVNYYGQITNKQISALKTRYKNVIFDNVQAFFQPPVPGIDTLYSCRKYFGVPDGGYLSTDAILTPPLPKDLSKDRMKHILGRFEGIASDYYGDFKASDHAFTEMDARQMSDLTHNLLNAVDYESVRQKRNKNYNTLANALNQQNPLPLTAPDGPYCYPFYCENGMAVKKKLAEKKIYVATLWPNVLDEDAPLEQDYTRNILPLPCDQRYNAEDMARIIKEVMECIG